MSLLIGALTIGFILSLLALGVFISFRIFSFPDITADGSSTLGAAVAAALIVKGVNPLLATGAGFAAGFLADLALAAPPCLMAACAAARRATGTRYGEQET